MQEKKKITSHDEIEKIVTSLEDSRKIYQLLTKHKISCNKIDYVWYWNIGEGKWKLRNKEGYFSIEMIPALTKEDLVYLNIKFAEEGKIFYFAK